MQKIHACINDCILYRGEEYENLNACPVCGALRYKIRQDDPGDVEGEPRPRKRVPAKVMWYAPIRPRLKRLFQNKEHAKLLRWHKEDHKKDVMLIDTPLMGRSGEKSTESSRHFQMTQGT